MCQKVHINNIIKIIPQTYHNIIIGPSHREHTTDSRRNIATAIRRRTIIIIVIVMPSAVMVMSAGSIIHGIRIIRR